MCLCGGSAGSQGRYNPGSFPGAAEGASRGHRVSSVTQAGSFIKVIRTLTAFFKNCRCQQACTFSPVTGPPAHQGPHLHPSPSYPIPAPMTSALVLKCASFSMAPPTPRVFALVVHPNFTHGYSFLPCSDITCLPVSRATPTPAPVHIPVTASLVRALSPASTSLVLVHV